MDRIARVLLGGSVDEAYVAGMERSLFAVVDDPLKQLSAFFLCIVLSAVVATGGVAASSPAIIIGAMIIAPLMMPIMGTSFAVTRGRPRQALRALAVAAGGAFVVVLVACLVTALLPAGVPLAGNVEATSRTAPARGPRGGRGVISWARSRRHATTSARRCRAAVAVSTVPPLCVAEPRSVQGALAMAGGRCCCSSSTSSPFSWPATWLSSSWASAGATVRARWRAACGTPRPSWARCWCGAAACGDERGSAQGASGRARRERGRAPVAGRVGLRELEREDGRRRRHRGDREAGPASSAEDLPRRCATAVSRSARRASPAHEVRAPVGLL